jgi:hypothetical protein
MLISNEIQRDFFSVGFFSLKSSFFKEKFAKEKEQKRNMKRKRARSKKRPFFAMFSNLLSKESKVDSARSYHYD